MVGATFVIIEYDFELKLLTLDSNSADMWFCGNCCVVNNNVVIFDNSNFIKFFEATFKFEVLINIVGGLTLKLIVAFCIDNRKSLLPKWEQKLFEIIEDEKM